MEAGVTYRLSSRPRGAIVSTLTNRSRLSRIGRTVAITFRRFEDSISMAVLASKIVADCSWMRSARGWDQLGGLLHRLPPGGFDTRNDEALLLEHGRDQVRNDGIGAGDQDAGAGDMALIRGVGAGIGYTFCIPKCEDLLKKYSNTMI